MSNTKNGLTKNHVLAVTVICLAIAAGIGLITNIGGLFLTPMAEELGTGRGNVSNTMSICNFVCAIAGMLLPKVINTKNFKKVVIAAQVATITSSFLLSYSNALWQLYALNAIRGFATGFSTTILGNIIINNWFLKNTGLVSSIAMSFSGLAGAVFSPIFGSLIKAVGWRMSYQISAGMMLALYIPYWFARVNLTPDSVGLNPYGERKTKKEETAGAAIKAVPWSVRGLLMFYAALAGYAVAMPQHFPGLAEHASLAVGSAMLSASMVTNTGGKLVMGTLVDKFGVRPSVLGVAVFVSVGYVLLMIPSSPLFLAGAMIVGCGYSLSTVGVTMLTRDMVGQKRFSMVYPSVAMCSTICYALGTSAVGYVYDFFKSYIPVLASFLVCEAIIICIVIVCGMIKKKKDF